MNCNIFSKICTVILFLVSIVLSWSGMIYMLVDPERVRMGGLLVSLVGYGLLFFAIRRFEMTDDRSS